MIGGAWPFLVRGVICLLNCVSNSIVEYQVLRVSSKSVSECELYVFGYATIALDNYDLLVASGTLLNATDVIATPC